MDCYVVKGRLPGIINGAVIGRIIIAEFAIPQRGAKVVTADGAYAVAAVMILVG